MGQEERIKRLEIEVELLKELIKTMMEEFKKFNQLADQIRYVTDEADNAISLINANFAK